ncbi:hypothetical protein FHW36_10548 [Chitinophaga polysaccharea]|uniref:Uncharacterized protein n=1 Tax=Chitinophaga polysaccharea TaxID=1293035 RepID=A0A561PNB9_9BACT|nr:hypothetical protein FHW36_10548 [Chitinophaga polysaccharea]
MADQQYFAVPEGFCFMMIHLFNQVRGLRAGEGRGRSIGRTAAVRRRRSVKEPLF